MKATRRREEDGTTRGRIALIVALVLTLVGIGVSVRLTVVYHEANASLEHKSACAINAKWDCDNVARSEHARLLRAPTSLWALAGYSLMAFFAAWGALRKTPRHWPLGVLLVLVLGAIAMSSYLAYASVFILKKKCLWCTVLYGVNLALLIALGAALTARKVGPVAAVGDDFTWLLDNLGVLGKLVGAGVVGAVLILLAGPHLGTGKAARKQVKVEDLVRVPSRPGMAADGMSAKDPSRLPPLPRGEPAWVAAMAPPGTPARGPKDADVYIVEFSDYQCPYCQMSNGRMEKILAKYGHRIRLYHRHFPLDTGCYKNLGQQMHKYACFAAAAAVCAQEQRKFWQFHNAQFRLGEAFNKQKILGLAKGQGMDMARFKACLKTPKTKQRIQEDLAAGDALKVKGTPTFFMGGPLLQKFEPPALSMELFDRLFAALDAAKKKLEKLRRDATTNGAGGASAPMAAVD